MRRALAMRTTGALRPTEPDIQDGGAQKVNKPNKPLRVTTDFNSNNNIESDCVSEV